MTAKSWWDHPERGLRLATAYHVAAEVIGWDRAIDFGMRVWEEKRPPSKAASNSVHGGGVGCIYVPKALTAFAGKELVKFAGIEDAALLVTAFCEGRILFPSDGRLEFPCVVEASIPRRNRAIAEQVRDGWPVAVVAFAFDLGEKQIRLICKAHGVSPKAAVPAMRARRKSRHEGVRTAVLEAARAGESIEDAAMQWGFMPDVAHAIVRGDPPVLSR